MASRICSAHGKYDCGEEQCKRQYRQRQADEDLEQAQQSAAMTQQIIQTLIIDQII